MEITIKRNPAEEIEALETFSVKARVCLNGMITTYVHFFKFSTEKKAESLARKIRRTASLDRLNLVHWQQWGRPYADTAKWLPSESRLTRYIGKELEQASMDLYLWEQEEKRRGYGY